MSRCPNTGNQYRKTQLFMQCFASLKISHLFAATLGAEKIFDSDFRHLKDPSMLIKPNPTEMGSIFKRIPIGDFYFSNTQPCQIKFATANGKLLVNVWENDLFCFIVHSAFVFSQIQIHPSMLSNELFFYILHILIRKCFSFMKKSISINKNKKQH